ALHAMQWRSRLGQPLRLPILLLGLVILQAAFGMWTVTLKLWPQVVVAHLLGGFATLALLFLLSVRLSGRLPPVPAAPFSLRLLAWLVLLLLIGQISLGGWVSANYAALACIDLPTCHGQWWPAMDFTNGFHVTQEKGPNYLGGQLDGEARTASHVAHRLGALLVSLGVLLLAWRLRAAALRGLSALLLLMLAVHPCLRWGSPTFFCTLPCPVPWPPTAGAPACCWWWFWFPSGFPRPAGWFLVGPRPRGAKAPPKELSHDQPVACRTPRVRHLARLPGADQAPSGVADADHLADRHVPGHPQWRALGRAAVRQPGHRPVRRGGGHGEPRGGPPYRRDDGAYPAASGDQWPGFTPRRPDLRPAAGPGRPGAAAGLHQPADRLAD